MDIRYQIFDDDKLLVQKISGNWDIGHYEAYIDMSMDRLNLQSIQKIMTDLREINVSFLFDDIKRLIQIRQKIAIQDFVNVYIVDEPASTAMAHLYQTQLQKKGYTYHYCSTVFQALRLLALPYTENEMQKKIQNLKQSF
jgi:hypothetical protein